MSDPKDDSHLLGLSEQEANRRLEIQGKNELPPAKERRFFRTLLSVVTEPMLLLLLICGGIYIVIGDRIEAAVLFSFVLFVLMNTLYQERKTERALSALKELSTPKAKVIRDGIKKQIDSRLLVRGDLICLAEGDRIPADAVLLSCNNLLTDEALLTGESLPVQKAANLTGQDADPSRRTQESLVYSSTLVVRGEGIAKVLLTGISTQVGHIGTALESVKIEKTSLQKESARVVRIFAGIGLSLCIIVLSTYVLFWHQWLKGILASLALAMAVLPEEIPMIFSIFMALGAWRMSQKHVLTRRIHAIEALGAATVLCVDKTGTLTLNKMSVERVIVGQKGYRRSDFEAEPFLSAANELLTYGRLASQKDPFDPMEIALLDLGKSQSLEIPEEKEWNLLREYPLTPQRFAMTHVFPSSTSKEKLVAAKGSPEAIAQLCRIPKEQLSSFLHPSDLLAQAGFRVIAVASATFEKDELPADQDGFSFSFLGFVGFSDPIRPQAKSTVQICRDAGIRVLMMTGDHPRTALSIGEQIGLPIEQGFLTGLDIDTMDDLALQKKSKQISIFARVSPQHKLRLVNALKASGEVVAMTGDGVNDAPALKAATIGIAMGNRGTDVAREAAALVLLDDNISSWGDAIHLGRRIYDNIRKAMAYTVAIHIPIAGLALIPVLLKWPLILMPVHIASLEMVIDPACSLIFEADEAEEGIMKRPPRKPNAPLFNTGMLMFSLLQGLGVLIFSLLGLWFTSFRHSSEPTSRSVAFFILVLGNLGLIISNRSWKEGLWKTLRKRNLAFWLILVAVFVLGILIVEVPFLRHLYQFGSLSLTDVGICFAGGFCSLAWSLCMKRLFQGQLQKPANT